METCCISPVRAAHADNASPKFKSRAQFAASKERGVHRLPVGMMNRQPPGGGVAFPARPRVGLDDWLPSPVAARKSRLPGRLRSPPDLLVGVAVIHRQAAPQFLWPPPPVAALVRPRKVPHRLPREPAVHLPPVCRRGISASIPRPPLPPAKAPPVLCGCLGITKRRLGCLRLLIVQNRLPPRGGQSSLAPLRAAKRVLRREAALKLPCQPEEVSTLPETLLTEPARRLPRRTAVHLILECAGQEGKSIPQKLTQSHRKCYSRTSLTKRLNKPKPPLRLDEI